MAQKYKDFSAVFPSGWLLPPGVSCLLTTAVIIQAKKKRYGVSGNNFICVFEIVSKDYFEGKKIKAKSLLAGGNSGNPLSAHFTDQLEMYTKGQFKEVLFYKEDVLKKAEKTYHPGE